MSHHRLTWIPAIIVLLILAGAATSCHESSPSGEQRQVADQAAASTSVVLARVKRMTTVNFRPEDNYPNCFVYDEYELLYIKQNGASYNLDLLLAANKVNKDKTGLEKTLLCARYAKRDGKVVDLKLKAGDIVELDLELFERYDQAHNQALSKIQVVDTLGNYEDPLFLALKVKVVKPAENVKKYERYANLEPAHVAVGKAGWLFFADVRFLSVYQSDAARLQAQLPQSKEIQKLLAVRDWLKQRGVELLVAIVPLRYQLLADEFPPALRQAAQGPPLGAVYDQYLRQQGINTIYAPQLFQADDKTRVCYRLGSHWTYYGAYLYYLELMKAMAGKFPGLAPASYDQLVVPGKHEDDDFLSQASLIADLVPPDHAPYCQAPEVAAADKRPDKPSIVMVHDSFGQYLQPFLKASLKNTAFLYSKYETVLNDGLLKKYKPDYFLIVYSEAYLDSLGSLRIE